MTKRFLIGSKSFFSKFPDFRPGDNDILIITDGTENSISYKRIRNTCMFTLKNDTKENILKLLLSKGRIFIIVPEVANYLGLSICDILPFRELFNNVEKKWKYQKFIFESYIENNGFFLTDKQLNTAYEIYKEGKGIL